MFDEQVTPEEQNQQEQQNQEQNAPTDGNNDQTAQDQEWFEIEGRKFDKSSAKTKIEHGDAHIQRLESELADLRDKASKLDKIDKLEELLTRQNQPQQQQQPNQPDPQNDNTNQFDEQKVKDGLLSEVENYLSEREKASIASENVQKAVQTAKQLYGDKYSTELERIGKELGMGRDAIKQMAADSPGVFNRLFLTTGSNPKPQPSGSQSTPRGSEQEQDRYKETARALLDKKTPASKRTEAIKALLQGAS